MSDISEWINDPFRFAGGIVIESGNVDAWDYYCEYVHKNHMKEAVQTLLSINNYSF